MAMENGIFIHIYIICIYIIYIIDKYNYHGYAMENVIFIHLNIKIFIHLNI